MDVSKRRAGAKGSVVGGSVWESRMKSDEVKVGIKVFNAEENAQEGKNGGARLKKSQIGSAVATGKRKTWKSESSEGFEKNQIQVAKGKSEPRKNCDEQCKELSISSDGIKKSPIQARKLKTEGRKEIGASADKFERSPIHTRKLRSETSKGATELGKEAGESGVVPERSSGQLRKSKSDSIKTANQCVKNVAGSASRNGENSIQLRKTKSELDQVSDESWNGVDGSAGRCEKIAVENGKNDPDENCKDVDECQEKVISSSSDSVGVVKCSPELSVQVDGDSDAVLDDEADEGDEEEEEDEEIEIEMEKESFDVKEISIPESKELENEKVVNEPEKEVVVSEPEKKKVVNEPEPEKVVNEPEKEVVVSEPEKKKVVNEPEPEKVVNEQEKKMVVSEPEKKKVVNEPEKKKVVNEPEPKKVVTEPENKKVVNEPEKKKVVNEPEKKMVVSEPEKKKVVNEPEKKVVNEPEPRKVVNEPEKKKVVNEPESKKVVNEPESKKVVSALRRFHQNNERPVSVPLAVKQSPPIRRHSTIYQNFSKSNSIPKAEEYSSFPQNQNKLQSLVDLIMWRDVSRSAFIFGIGTFIIISSSYAKDINLSLISVTSYVGLVYLAVIFLYRSLICRGVLAVEDTNYVLGEEEAIWVLKLFLPYLNEFLSKLRALFSGDPGTTIKLAVLLFVLARCGSSIAIWKMAKFGFFGVFTVPKICSSYSAQLTAYANFWIRRFRDAWDSCSHKKAVALGIFGLVWNLSSVVTRIWAAFVLFVAFRYYQQHYLVRDEWVEDEAACDETWQEPVQVGAQKQGRAPNFVEINKVKKGF